MTAFTFGAYTVSKTCPGEDGFVAYRTEFGTGAWFIAGTLEDCVTEAKRRAAKSASVHRAYSSRSL